MIPVVQRLVQNGNKVTVILDKSPFKDIYIMEWFCLLYTSIIGYFIAAISGIFFPVCECAIIPITRSLIKKGLPIGVGVTFMLAVPIVNPVVIMSTYYAFPNNINVVIYRTIGGVIGALIIGLLTGVIYDKKKKEEIIKDDTVGLYCDCCTYSNNYYISLKGKIKNLILNASNEFLNIRCV